MASATRNQHCRVFVGNIPYDATEEQLIQICEEVGPVVNFRLVVDRETQKPKGYGFCEYKDEETALSARRNLQGYEINGRQLRVDFAEIDKGADRNREQGRGGSGLISNNATQRPLPAPPILGDSSLHQPMGLPLASTAASVMAKVLGGSQITNMQNLSGLGNDSLTHYISKISRHQLNEIMSELKALAAQNKPLARQLLQESPQLPKALFQAQIMMGLVSPQMMQMASGRQSSSSLPQPSLKDNTQEKRPIQPSYLGQIRPQKEEVAIYSMSPEVSNVLPNSASLQQSASPLHVPFQSQRQHPWPLQHQVHPQGVMPGKPGVHPATTLQHQTPSNISIQPRTPPLLTSESSTLQMQTPLLHHPRPTAGVNTAHHSHGDPPSTSLRQLSLPDHVTSQIGSSGPSMLNGLETLPKKSEPSTSTNQNLTWSSKLSTHPNSGIGSVEQTGISSDMSELINHPSKRPRFDNGSCASQAISSISVSGQSIAPGSLSANQIACPDRMQQSEKQMSQFLPIPLGVESALLQQVMTLTPEQLSSLPLEQQQQVLQLQQMLHGQSASRSLKIL